jgi:ATP-dependent RNA helicase HelY
VVAVLDELGYTDDFTLTEKGERLRRIYGEGDLLVAEAIEEGLFDALSPPEAGGLASAVLYESRDRVPRRPEVPTPALRARFRAMGDLWGRVRQVEESHQVELSRELDEGFASTIFDWAEGKPLEDVLGESGMTPGDFVRTTKQILDLLRQIREVAPEGASATAAAAADAINRSVVAYTGV